jgi:urea carboxylase
VLHRHGDCVARLAGDRYVFLEFGPMELDFGVRAKVAEVERWLRAATPKGALVESRTGVRSVLLEYDADVISLVDFLKLLERCARAPRLPACRLDTCARTHLR